MKLIEKVLRAPLAPEILALLEKIDAIDSTDDDQYSVIERLLDIKRFGSYEIRMLRRAMYKIKRRDTLNAVMHVVVKNAMPQTRLERLMEQQSPVKGQFAGTISTSQLNGVIGLGYLDTRAMYGQALQNVNNRF